MEPFLVNKTLKRVWLFSVQSEMEGYTRGSVCNASKKTELPAASHVCSGVPPEGL